MTRLTLLLWLANIVFDTAGQLAFKAAAMKHNTAEGLAYWRNVMLTPWIWVGAGCYAAEFLLWLAFLSLVPLSEGVLLGSINIVAIMLAGRLIFGERLTRYRLIGMALVAAGVAVVGAG